MAFPVNGVLDTFDRANSDGLGSNWTEPMFSADTSSDWDIVSNQAKGNGGSGVRNSVYWNVATFGPNCEAYMDIQGTVQNNRLFEVCARIHEFTSTTPDGYAVRVAPVASGDQVRVFRIDDGAYTQLGADIAQEIAAGDAIGIECSDDQISAYYKPFLGSWASLGARTDATYNTAGNIGMVVNHTTFAFDNFGGGTLGGGSDTQLVVADATQASNADNIALTQQHLLAVADATQASTADNVSLTQQHLLAVADATQASTADNVVLSTSISLVVADAVQASSADNVSLTQAQLLAVSDAVQASNADNVALVQAYVVTVQETVQASNADNISVTQAFVLAANDAIQAQTADSPALIQAYVLTVADAVQGSNADNLNLSTDGNTVLVVQDAVQASNVDNLALVQAQLLAVQDAAQASNADAVALFQAHLLSVSDASSAQTADSPALIQASVLAVSDAVQAHSVDNVVLVLPGASILSEDLFRGMFRGMFRGNR